MANANKGKYYLSQEDDLNARIASLTRKIEAMELKKVKEVKSAQNEDICVICEHVGHSTNECPNLPICKEVLHEHVNAFNTFKKSFFSPCSKSYNHQWKNYPNFSWRNENHVQPPQFQRP